MERSSCKGRGGFFIESEPFYISRGPLQRFLRFFRALGSLTFSLSLRYATRLANIHNFRSLETHFISNRKSFFTSVFLEFQRVCDLTVSNLIFFLEDIIRYVELLVVRYLAFAPPTLPCLHLP